MNLENFMTVGENIHCTRMVKSGGKRTTKLPDGGEGVTFRFKGEDRVLAVPSNWAKVSSAYKEGKIRHIALAIHHAHKGTREEDRKIGEDYLCWAAERQIDRGATFLDVNVDEL